MAIRTPHWAPAGTHPTEKGWVSATGEVLKKQKFTAEEIAEWHGPAAAVKEPAPKKQTLHEAPVVETVIEPEVESFHYEEPKAAVEAPAEPSEDEE